MFRQADVELQIAQHQCRGDTGYQNRGEHGGHHDVKQVIAGVESGDSDQHHGHHVGDAHPGHVIVESVAHASPCHAPRQVGHGGQPHHGRQQQSDRRQNDRRPETARLPRHGRKQGGAKSQDQARNRQQEARPYFGNSPPQETAPGERGPRAEGKQRISEDQACAGRRLFEVSILAGEHQSAPVGEPGAAGGRSKPAAVRPRLRPSAIPTEKFSHGVVELFRDFLVRQMADPRQHEHPAVVEMLAQARRRRGIDGGIRGAP